MLEISIIDLKSKQLIRFTFIKNESKVKIANDINNFIRGCDLYFVIIRFLIKNFHAEKVIGEIISLNNLELLNRQMYRIILMLVKKNISLLLKWDEQDY